MPVSTHKTFHLPAAASSNNGNDVTLVDCEVDIRKDCMVLELARDFFEFEQGAVFV